MPYDKEQQYIMDYYESFDEWVKWLRRNKRIDTSTAKDIVEDVFIHLLNTQPVLDPERGVAYIKKCLSNKYNTYYNRKYGRESKEQLYHEALLQTTLFENEPWSDSVYVLAEQYAPYVRKVYRDGMTLKEAAKHYKVKWRAVEGYLRRGRRNIKKHLKALVPLVEKLKQEGVE